MALTSANGLPWKLADILSLKNICAEAGRLHVPAEVPTGGLMGPLCSKYPNFDAAHDALVRHPIYVWLRLKLPRAIELAGAVPDVQCFRFVFLVAGSVHSCNVQARDPPGGMDRVDKKRVAAHKAIERVEPFIADGTVELTAAKTEMLSRLLAEARSGLMANRGRRSMLWALEKLACELQQEFAIADTRLILAIAAVTGLSCSESTARRIVQATHSK